MAHIFISYSRKDLTHAEALAVRLRTSGASVWMDTTALAGADTWSAEIVGAIKTCTAMLVLLSPNSIASHNVTKEVGLASEKEKPIIPVELTKCELSDAMEYALAGLQRIALSNEEALHRSLEKFGISLDGQPAEHKTEEPTPATKLRLAVLPFDDLSPSHDNEWFADGMMDELINALGSIEELDVASRTDVIYYKKHKPNPAELVADLKISYVVEGSVQKSGEKIRIRVSLIDAKAHKQIWSEKYDGSFDDIFDLQDRTAKSIVEELKIKLTPDEKKKLEKKETDNPEAYEAFLKAGQYYRRNTRTDFEHALGLYEEAVRLDPGFARAYAGITTSCCMLFSRYGDTKNLDCAEQAIAGIDRAEGHSALWNWAQSHVARHRNDLPAALEYAKRAVELDPHAPISYDVLAFANESLGDLRGAAEARERSIALRKSYIMAHVSYIENLKDLGDTERLCAAACEALPIFERHMRLAPDDHSARVHYAYILTLSGAPEAGREAAIKAAAIENLDATLHYNLSRHFLYLGDTDRGLEELQKAVATGYRKTLVFADADFDSIRHTPEFKALLVEMDRSK